MGEPSTARRSDDSLSRGVGITLRLHLVCQAVFALGAVLLTAGDLWSLLFPVVFGLTQWVYLIPCLIYLHARGFHATARGVWLIGGLGLLAFGACWGLGTAGTVYIPG